MMLNNSLIAFFQRCFISVLLACLFTETGYAEDSLSALMQRMKSETAVKIEYQEIRSLELMDQPWVGEGKLYTLPPHIIIKQQLQPETVLMAVDKDTLYYFDKKNGVRHQTEMDENDPVSLNIIVFKALVTGDDALLKRYYSLKFSSKPKRWMLLLTPKQKSSSDFSVVVTGLLGQDADLIRIKQTDGDVKEFLLKKSETSTDIKKVAEQLYQELQGD
jgi:outer membrane lipoprotein-sorting protein